MSDDSIGLSRGTTGKSQGGGGGGKLGQINWMRCWY